MMLRKWLVSALLVAFLGGAQEKYAAAQSGTQLPGCQASPEVQRILKDKLGPPEFQNLTSIARNAMTAQVARGLIEKYPRELEPYLRLIVATKRHQAFHAEQLAKLQEEFDQKAKEHPDDPLMLYLAATAQRDKDAPQSIELDDRAIALAPKFPWPYADPTGIYRTESHAVTKKVSGEGLS